MFAITTNSQNRRGIATADLFLPSTGHTKDCASRAFLIACYAALASCVHSKAMDTPDVSSASLLISLPVTNHSIDVSTASGQSRLKMQPFCYYSFVDRKQIFACYTFPSQRPKIVKLLSKNSFLQLSLIMSHRVTIDAVLVTKYGVIRYFMENHVFRIKKKTLDSAFL